MVSWSTVTVAKENPEHVRAFVAWHLGAGADEVLLYYDDPKGHVTDFDHLPQVKLVLCNADYWETQGGRPDSRVERQIHGATMGYRAARSNWICHCDIDEFIFGDNIGTKLESIPAEKTCARMLPVERIFVEGEENTVFSDIFRVATKGKHPDWIPEIYAYPNHLTRGFRGHRNGKVFARTGIENVIFRAHNIEVSGVLQNRPIFREMLDDVRLLHLFTFGFEHFKEKGQWKFKRGPELRKKDSEITEPNKIERGRVEMADIIDSGDSDALKRVFNDTFVFSANRLKKLSEHQEILTLEFTETLRARLDKFFP